MNRIALTLIIFLLAGVFASPGCSKNPVTPSVSSGQDSGLTISSSNVNNHHMLGSYDIVIEAGTNQVNTIPDRSTDFHFNLTKIFIDTFSLSVVLPPGQSDPPNGLFVVDFTLTHPFDTETEFTIFDVKGIVMAPGTLPIGSLFFSDVDETQLENADGFTRWWNPAEFTQSGVFGYIENQFANTPGAELTASVNPYRYFADILDNLEGLQPVFLEPLNNDMGRGVFTTGTTNTRRYNVRFPMLPAPDFRFSYVIDACWALPAPNPPLAVPDDFPIEANQPEAFNLVLVDKINTLYYDVDNGLGGGVLQLKLNVHDWQGQALGDIAAQVESVRIFSPDLFPGGVSAVFDSQTALKASYTADLTGTAIPTSAGKVLVAVKVKSAGGPDYNQGFTYPAPDTSVAAWQTLILDIPEVTCTPDANNDFNEALPVSFDSEIYDQICLPNDYKDFYEIQITGGYAYDAKIELFCDVSQTKVGLYDSTHTLVREDDIVGGSATIPLSDPGMETGQYFIRVYTSNPSQIAPYVLKLTGPFASPDSPVDITPDGLFLEPNFIWIHDNYAIMGGDRLWIYDISDPSNPVYLQAFDYTIRDFATFNYPYLYYSDSNDLSLLDLTTPEAPVSYPDIITFEFSDQLYSMCSNSTHLYLSWYDNSMGDYYMLFYDISSDPTNPIELNNFLAPYSCDDLDLLDPEGPATSLLMTIHNELYSYLIEDPLNPQLLATHTYPANNVIQETVVDDGYIYTAVFDTIVHQGYTHILHTNILTPKGSVNVPGTARSIDISWPYVTIGDGPAGFSVCDATDPDNPQYDSTVPMVTDGMDVAAVGDYAYITPDSQGLEIFSINPPGTPSLSRQKVVNYCISLVIKDGYLLVVDYNKAVKTIDISNPANVYVAAEFWVNDFLRDMSLDQNLLMTAGGKQWSLNDVSDPLAITDLAYTVETHDVSQILLQGDHAYVAIKDPAKTVRIYSIAIPSAPVYVTSITFPSTVRDIMYYSPNMYYALQNSIEIYTADAPMPPAYVGSYSNSPDIHYDLTSYGSRMYILTSSELQITDLTNPDIPVHVCALPLPGVNWLSEIYVDGYYAYAYGFYRIPEICSIWPPDSPAKLGYLYDGMTWAPSDLVTLDGYLYLGTGGRGLKVFDLY